MKNTTSILLMIALAAVASDRAISQTLGTARGFGVLSGSTLTNTGPSVVEGNIGVWPGTTITGLPPGIIVGGTVHTGDAVAHQAQSDLTAAYNALAMMPATQNLTGADLGGRTLFPGVYFFSSSAQLTSALTLDARGDSAAVFVFQIGSTLTTAAGSSVLNINGAQGCNVYWQVGSSATLGVATSFTGSVMAAASITLNTGSSIIDGGAYAMNGAVTLDSNRIVACTPIPTPGSAAAVAVFTFGLVGKRVRGKVVTGAGTGG